MSPKKQERHQIIVEATAIKAAGLSVQEVPAKKNKEDAKELIYLNRI